MTAKIEASKTCFSLSATAPATDDLAGRAGIADYAAFRIIREMGDQTDTRSVTKLNTFCSGAITNDLGEIDYGNMTFTIAYDPADEGAVVADAQFQDNAVIYGKRVLDNGNLRFYDMRISSRGEAFAFGAEVARTYTFEIDSKFVDNS